MGFLMENGKIRFLFILLLYKVLGHAVCHIKCTLGLFEALNRRFKKVRSWSIFFGRPSAFSVRLNFQSTKTRLII